MTILINNLIRHARNAISGIDEVFYLSERFLAGSIIVGVDLIRNRHRNRIINLVETMAWGLAAGIRVGRLVNSRPIITGALAGGITIGLRFAVLNRLQVRINEAIIERMSLPSILTILGNESLCLQRPVIGAVALVIVPHTIHNITVRGVQIVASSILSHLNR